MIIKLLQDNTVHVRYDDGSSQTLNSTHSHKARNEMVKAVCDANPYKGAMEFASAVVDPVTSFDAIEDCPEPLKASLGDFHAELVALKAAQDGEEDVQATETVEVEEETVEITDGVAVVKKVKKTKEVKLEDELVCVDENGDGICDECGTTHKKFPITKPKTVKVPKMIKGTPLSDTAKTRLNELLGA